MASYVTPTGAPLSARDERAMDSVKHGHATNGWADGEDSFFLLTIGTVASTLLAGGAIGPSVGLSVLGCILLGGAVLAGWMVGPSIWVRVTNRVRARRWKRRKRLIASGLAMPRPPRDGHNSGQSIYELDCAEERVNSLKAGPQADLLDAIRTTRWNIAVAADTFNEMGRVNADDLAATQRRDFGATRDKSRATVKRLQEEASELSRAAYRVQQAEEAASEKEAIEASHRAEEALTTLAVAQARLQAISAATDSGATLQLADTYAEALTEVTASRN